MNKIDIKNLKKSYGIDEVFKGLNLTIDKNGMFAIMGSSGSGKSTLLNIIGTLDNIYEGKVNINGINLKKMSERERTDLRKNKIGFIYQFHYLINSLNVLDNIILPSRLISSNINESKKKALKLMDMLGIVHIKDRMPSNISGGEKQRVAIARALINDPSIILADEPTGNLDSDNSLSIANVLKNISRDMDKTILLVTHDEQISKLADKIFKIEKGVIL